MAMMVISVLGSAATLALATQSPLPITRMLEGDNGQAYAYLDDVSGYSFQFGNCVRAKIPNENDDDGGNGFFYNGRYHAQYMRYATFHLCSNNGNGCKCDYSVEYATDMDQFLESTLGYLDQYCGQCQAMCGRRMLEENNNVDCNTCSSQCANYGKGQNGADETAYLGCNEGYVDGDGIQYYYGPQCSDGGIQIGLFYDDECTVKTSQGEAPEFDYYIFHTVTDMCMDCSIDDTCDQLYQDSLHCYNGKEARGMQDDMNVCSTVKKATTTHEYSSKSRRSGADKFFKVFFITLSVVIVGGFFFLTYAYYIRHRGERGLAAQDHHVDSEVHAGTLT
mmetsp:Transcript_30480/g.62036  ORF Transcript_30480/g.62036 Transcript_30480/m.62036 type:complete len:335 (+) Transcript_30480:73-1077(+)